MGERQAADPTVEGAPRPQGGGTQDTPDETQFAAIIYVLVSGCTWRRLSPAWERGIKPLIARRGDAHGPGIGKVRWVVERTFAWPHQLKRLRTRYERRADLHQGMLELACSLLCLRRLRTSP
ncbi:hypothetical protein GCM10010503_39770 [Streptomyces lucensis JCM 4490]|uniref:Transposase IS4-like domain-containing protein n=1 Tax=Streptomyces lucensis JCM 4490 TaxID=1306176 RepID=A0A918J9P7_9ACTN|nr:hypothetical protein GCM10010503_39770 [Streptomyces lucensis JCM 4490]